MTMDSEYTAEDIAQALNITARAVQKRARKEGWRAHRDKGRGGVKYIYPIVLLPQDVQISLSIHWRQQQEPKAPLAPPVPIRRCNRRGRRGDLVPVPKAAQAGIDIAQVGPGKKFDGGMFRAALLARYEEHLAKYTHGGKDYAKEEFMLAYNSGQAYPQLYKEIGPLSWKTIESWKLKVLAYRGDTACLIDRRGLARKGQSALTPAQQELILRCVLHPNQPFISEAIRMARAVSRTANVPCDVSDACIRRWVEKWKDTHYHIWVFHREGAKAWNDKCALSIERDYSLINVGDILVADGHTLNFEVIDPFTGRAKRMTLILWYDMKSNFPLGWELMGSENTQAIAAALRRAIMRLGKYPKVLYLDNGKAFASRFFNGQDLAQGNLPGAFQRLGCQVIFAWPYHAQSKTVERFFGTFGELERMAPTYSGTCVEKKPPRMNRGEVLHRAVWEKAMGGQGLTIGQAHNAIAAWFDEYTGRPQRGHLSGQCPMGLFADGKGPGVDPAELRYLMMSVEVRSIHKNGITLLNQNYYDPALYGRKHKVKVYYDLMDMAQVYVCEPEDGGQFICAATPIEKCHPAAAQLGDAEDQARLVEHIRTKKRQEREASTSARQFLQDEILPEYRKQLEIAGMCPDGSGPTIAATRPELRLITAAEVAKVEAEVERLQAVQDEMKAREAEQLAAKGYDDYIPVVIHDDELSRAWRGLPGMNEMDQYEKLMEFELRGIPIPDEWQATMRYYESSAAYERLKDYYQERRRDYAAHVWDAAETVKEEATL